MYLSVLNGTATPATPDPARIAEFESSFLEIRMFYVGKGEGVLVVSPEGDAWLIDAGRSKTLAKKLLEYLLAEGLTLKAVIATHPHSDHAKALTTILATPHSQVDKPLPFIRSDDPWWFKPNTKWLPQIRGAIATGAVETVIQNAHIELELGNLTTAMVFSYSDAVNDGYRSAFVHLRFRDATILFTGDAYEEYEKNMEQQFGIEFFKSDVLKVTHHGSRGGTDDGVLAKIDPGFAFVSNDAINGADHGVSNKVRVALVNQGVTLFETFQNDTGLEEHRDIVIRTDGRPLDSGGVGVLYRVERVVPKLRS